MSKGETLNDGAYHTVTIEPGVVGLVEFTVTVSDWINFNK